MRVKSFFEALLLMSLMLVSCDKEGSDNNVYIGHEYVDLGLPSGLKWATCNVGASSPEDFGGYYQWAGTLDAVRVLAVINPKIETCPYHIKGEKWNTGWTKYVHFDMPSCWSGTGDPDNKTELEPRDDVANVNWRGYWRMPTEADWKELSNTDYCSWTWTAINGVNGYMVQSKRPGYTDNWIFLPVAGYRSSLSLVHDGKYGFYWSSSLDKGSVSQAYRMYFNEWCTQMEVGRRNEGLSVRPVLD